MPINPATITRLLSSKRFQQAEDLCRKSIEADPEDPHAWFYLAAVQSQSGRSADAVKSLNNAAAYPADDGFRLRLAQALIQLRAFRLAQPILEGLDFSIPPVVLGLARCSWGQGRYENALRQMKGLLEAVPAWPEAAVSYARSLVSLDRLEEAGKVLDAALGHHPDHQELINQRLCWLVSAHGIRAAHEWCNELDIQAPSARLRLFATTLAELNGDVVSVPPSLGERDLAQWEGFRDLRGHGGNISWFGDNVALLKHVARSAPDRGIIVECGVFHGRSINLMAKWTGREIHGFDSFEGLPEEWTGHNPAGSYSAGGRLPEVPANVQLHPGWFEDTLPPFAAGLSDPIALLYVDCDLYSSTCTVLEHLGPHLAPGALLVFDEYTGYVAWREHEYKAWMEYREARSLGAAVHSAELLGQTVAWRLS